MRDPPCHEPRCHPGATLNAAVALPYEMRDTPPRREPRHGPMSDSDLPEIMVCREVHPARSMHATTNLKIV